MPANLPLLIFPKPVSIIPPRGKGFAPSSLSLPGRSRQSERLDPQIDRVREEFSRFRGLVDVTMAGGEPESVLVLELADRVDDLARAVEAAGLEWLGEWDIEIDPDDDFPAAGKKATRDGRLFVSMVNEEGMRELLSLWDKWKRGKPLGRGKTKWRDIFACLKNIRRWGMQETLAETEIRDYIEDLSDDGTASLQIECFYRKNQEKREIVEDRIKALLNEAGGETVSDFVHMPEIAFHAVKARIPVNKAKELLSKPHETAGELHLFIYPSIIYFRRTGQSMTAAVEGDGEIAEYPETRPSELPVAAILDGVPNLKHKALENRVDFDDPFDLESEYQPGERRHGTAMASLIIHGDRSDEAAEPLQSKVHHVAIIQPDPAARNFGKKEEYFPEDCFYEDRIARAVRRMLDRDGEVEAQAPAVKIINLSLGDSTRPFLHTLSPWARLLDWFSWKYRVLFCVSAGNYEGDYDFGISFSEYKSKNNEEKARILLESMQGSLSSRRLIAPAESINSLTVGALHQDESGNGYHLGNRVDLLPGNRIPSPISRLGHGFRRSIKPEIYFPGGRQLYGKPFSGESAIFEIDDHLRAPGQKTAWDSEEGELSKDAFNRGTSNAAALATRAGVRIHGVLSELNDQNSDILPNELTAVLIKTLLVHGSVQNRESKTTVEHLRNQANSRTFRMVQARYLGYGAVDVDRVLACTEQRGTIIGFGEITAEEIHEYRFPVPDGFGGQKIFRRMVVTLAWFSPINPGHRYFREAKLEIKPSSRWDETPLKLRRTDSDHNQNKRGTVQHEVLEGKNELERFRQNEEIVLQVICKKDATEKLEEKIPYGLAVTLEAAEESQISVYEEIRQRLSEQVEARAEPL